MRPRFFQRALALGLALAAATLALPARAGDVSKSVKLGSGDVNVTVKFDDDSLKLWATTVLSTLEQGLPKLEDAAGFPAPFKELVVEYAADGKATGGFEAQWKGDGKLAVKKKAARPNGGYHAHWVLTAVAHAWSEKAVSEPWAVEALAHFYTWHALKDLPGIYEWRTYRDELVQEAAKAGEKPLDGWKPAANDNAEDRPVAYPEASRAMLFLCCIERHFGDGCISKAIGKSVTDKKTPLDTAGLELAVAFAAAKPETEMKPYFFGWAMAPKDAANDKPIFKTTDIHDDDDDSLLNFEETEVGTDPKLNDTDGDGLLDGEEVFSTHTDPKAKDAPKAALVVDGDPKKWMKLKKFQVLGDPKNPTKSGDTSKGAKLLKCDVACDAHYVYFLIVADDMKNPEIAYNIQMDTNGDGVNDYIFGFRCDKQRWLGDTHGDKDISWCEWKNDRGIKMRFKDDSAEFRIPLTVIGNPKKMTFVVYTKGKDKDKPQLDTLLKSDFDFDRWRVGD